MPIEITFTKPPDAPVADSCLSASSLPRSEVGMSTVGGIMRSSSRVGASVMPMSPGIEKPCTSASIMPTARPREANAAARLAVIEDFPTPPLPETTPKMRVSDPGTVKGLVRSGLSRDLRAPRCSEFMAPSSSCTRSIPVTAAAASRTWVSIVFLSGHPSMVSRTFTWA